MRKRMRFAGLIWLLAQTAGCAGVFNPHVDWDRNFVKDKTRKEHISMDDAFTYADRAIDAYNGAMGRNAILESSAGLAFLVLSAGAIGSAATGGTAHDVTWLGISAGSAFGIGSWLGNKPRRIVYAAAVGAMTCAKQAMIPYKISDADLLLFTDALDALASSVPGVRAVPGAETVADSYASLVRSGDALRTQFDQSAELLITTVDRIGSEVNKALVSTSPDLSAVQGLITGIASGYGQVSPPQAPPAIPPDTQARVQRVPLIRATVVAPPKVCADAAACAEIVQNTIRRFGTSLPIEGLKACGVSEAIVAPLAMKPNALIEVKAADGSVDRRLMEGGSGRYVASLLTEKKNAPAIKQPTPLGAQIEITVTKDTPEGKYQAVVVDAASERKIFFEIDVSK